MDGFTGLPVLVVTKSLGWIEPAVAAIQSAGYEPVLTIVSDEDEYRAALRRPQDAILIDLCSVDKDLHGFLQAGLAREEPAPIFLVTDLEHESLAFAGVNQGVCGYVYRDRLTGLGVLIGRSLGSQNPTCAERSPAEDQSYRLLFKKFQDIILFARVADGQILDANRAAEEAYGLGREELLSRTLYELHMPRHFQVVANMIDQAYQQGAHFETWFRRKDGSRFPIEISAFGTTLRGEQVCVGIIRDISERYHDRQSAEESQQRLEGLVRALPMGAHFYDLKPSGDLIFAGSNPAADRILGNRHADLVGKTIEEAFPPLIDTPIPQMYRRTAATGEPYSEEQVIYEGGKIHGCFQIHAFQTRPSQMAVVFQDVTRQKKEFEEQRFRGFLLDNISEAIVSTDLQSHIQSWNRASEDMYGWKAEEVIGRTLEDVFQSQFLPGERDQILQYFNQNGHWRGEVVHSRKDGSHFPVYSTVQTLKGEDGKPVGIMIANRTQALLMLERISRTLRTRSECSQILTRSRDEADLLSQFCHAVVKYGEYPLAWVGYAEMDEERSVRMKAKSGTADGYLDGIRISWADNAYGQGPSGTSIRTGQPAVARNILSDPRYLPWREQALASGFQSSLGLPLTVGGQVIGALNIYSIESEGFDPDELALLKELAEDLAFGIHTMRTRVSREQAEQALSETEERYRLLFSSGNDAVFVFPLGEDGTPGSFTDVNAIACQRLGYTRDELLGMSVFEVNCPGQNFWVADHTEELKRDGHLLFTTQHVTRDGKKFPVEINASLIHLGGQRTVFAIARDITERIKAEGRIKSQLERLSALQAIDQSILTAKDLNQTLDILLEQITRTLQVDGANILLYDPRIESLVTARERGLAAEPLWSPGVAMLETHAGKIALSRSSEFIPDLGAYNDRLTHRLERLGLAFTSYLGYPLESQGELKGVLQLFQKEPLQPDEEWLGFLRAIAGQAAIAIDHAQLVQALTLSNQELTAAYDKTIEGWAHALDLRDHETEGHSRRVMELTASLADQMGIGEDDRVFVKWGALLHDIGKVGVPDKILFKNGPLDEDEWRIMRKHPLFALDLLDPIEFLHPAMDIPYSHHEKWDGTGYPRGLKGEEIPFAARIFAVVDVWDALTSDRPYRKAWTKAMALDYLNSQTGKHFDPAVIGKFMEFVGAGG